MLLIFSVNTHGSFYKRGITITNAFQKILDEFNSKPNKKWVDKGSEFYNRSMKSRLEKKYMTSISQNVYIDKLDDIVHKYNNTYHSTIKMKPADVKSSTYIESSKEINDKNPKFKIGDFVRISKYKNIFAKGYVPNWSEEVFVIKKFKNTVLWTCY